MVVEIGSGKGAFLLAATEAQPDTFVLGIEAAPGYAQYSAARLHNASRNNGLLLLDNGKVYLQDRVPEARLAAVHVLFPDPWPKRRHQARRFFTPETPAILARVLEDGGQLFVATDNAAYGGRICSIMGQSTDFVLFLMTRRSIESLLKSKFILGGDVSVAAGPVGRSAEGATDAKLNAEIIAYAKSRGLFAGASIEGARLAADQMGAKQDRRAW